MTLNPFRYRHTFIDENVILLVVVNKSVVTYLSTSVQLYTRGQMIQSFTIQYVYRCGLLVSYKYEKYLIIKFTVIVRVLIRQESVSLGNREPPRCQRELQVKGRLWPTSIRVGRIQV